jgi:hypothetical protein
MSGYWPSWPQDTPVGWVRHVGCGELEFRQAGHPANDRLLHVEWKPVYVKVDDR